MGLPSHSFQAQRKAVQKNDIVNVTFRFYLANMFIFILYIGLKHRLSVAIHERGLIAAYSVKVGKLS